MNISDSSVSIFSIIFISFQKLVFGHEMMKTLAISIMCVYLFYISDSTKISDVVFDNKHCKMHAVLLRIRHKNCMPIKLRARACNGACTSYTKVSTGYPWKLEQSCNCCQYAGRKRKRFGMKCPHGRDKRNYRVVVMSVTLPRGCRCRPCSTEPNAIVAPETTMFNTSPIIGDLYDIF